MNNASIIANASALMNDNILDEMNEGIASLSCPKFGGCKSIALHNLINTQKQWDEVHITLLCLLFTLKYTLSIDQSHSQVDYYWEQLHPIPWTYSRSRHICRTKRHHVHPNTYNFSLCHIQFTLMPTHNSHFCQLWLQINTIVGRLPLEANLESHRGSHFGLYLKSGCLGLKWLFLDHCL